jgi:putative transposase
LLKLTGLARSTFYHQRLAMAVADKHSSLKVLIQSLFDQHKGRYGYRRITAALQKAGEVVNHKTVQRLMGVLKIKSIVRPKKYRAYRGAVGKIAPDLLKRDFQAHRPNQKWVTDVTEFKVAGEKLYLSPVMDLYNGEIVAYQTNRRPSFDLVTGMLDKAFSRLSSHVRLTLHSDQGWQYQMENYRYRLRQQAVKQSMSRKGNCLDNAAMESFFGTLKSEFFYTERFETIEQLQSGLDEYIHYYNHDRIKLKLNGLSPMAYRTRPAAA